MKKTVGIIGLLILVALGWIAWPYYAVYDFAKSYAGNWVMTE